MEMEKFEKSVEFVACHYRRGAFDTDSALRRMGFRRRSTVIMRRAAIFAGAVAMTASALYFGYRTGMKQDTAQPQPVEQQAPQSKAMQVVRLEFNDVPLSKVTDEICRVYGVTLANLPVEEYRLTLSYEGNSYDLVATINELLGT